MHISSAFIINSLALVVLGQSAAQNASAASFAAQIPDCARPCDDAAITEIGCGLTDYACHCANGAQLANLIPPCLTSNSTCSPSDLQSMYSFVIHLLFCDLN
jgi:hypothetical protein